MAWSDIFYPDNPKRRREVVELCTRIAVHMEYNFEATNSLSDLVNTHMKPSPLLKHIQVDPDADIDTNASKLTAQMDEIQVHVKKVDDELAEKLKPELYEKLKDAVTPFKEKMKIAKDAVSITLGIGAAGIFLASNVWSKISFATLSTAFKTIGKTVLGVLGLGILTMGLDMVASAIIGAVERNKLEAAVDELEAANKDFEPASKEYSRTIMEVELRLEIHFEL